MKNKNGFTLIELLAVLIILGAIIVIAVPKVMNTIANSKKASLETATMTIISTAEKMYLDNQANGKSLNLKCSDVVDMKQNEYGLCKITFDEEGHATVILNGKKDGKFDNLSCSGTKEGVTCDEGEIKPGLQCTFDGELVPGAEFVHNQYTYRYMQENYGTWEDTENEGWGVKLTDLESTAPVNTPICSYINGKPLISTAYMFYEFDENTSDEFVTNAEYIDVSLWDTDNVINMEGMFLLLDSIEIKGLDKLETSKVTNTVLMFGVGTFNNLNLRGMDLSNVTNAESMFAYSIFNTLDLRDLDLSNVTNIDYMFQGAEANLINLSGINMKKLSTINQVFIDANIKTLNLSNVNLSGILEINDLFSNSTIETLDMSNIDLSNLISMKNLYSDTTINTLNLKGADLSGVTNVTDIFKDSTIKTIDMSDSDMSSVTSMKKMFDYNNASIIDLSGMNAKNVTDMSYMFGGVGLLTYSGTEKIDISRMNVSNVKTMEGMFTLVRTKLIVLDRIDTSNVTNMSDMFYDCHIEKVDLSKLITSNVTNMIRMFSLNNTEELDLSNFDISKVTTMGNMFDHSGIKTVYVSTQTDADKFNASGDIPIGLSFIVK